MRLFAVILCFVVLSCAARRNPYYETNRVYARQADEYAELLEQYPVRDSVGFTAPAHWAGTVNFSLRKPNYVVIHHTAQDSCGQTLRTFTLKRTQVSAHYVICKDGTVHHMLNDYFRAWHAGTGRWGNVTDLNSVSIGIELDNNGREPFPESQMQALYTLLDRLKRAYSIPAANFIAHADLAPTRKNDPNVHFDWQQMATKGFGLWYGDTTGVALPTDFNTLQALRIVGYDLRDTTAAITAFKRKFLKQDNSRKFAPGELKVLYLMMKQSM